MKRLSSYHNAAPMISSNVSPDTSATDLHSVNPQSWSYDPEAVARHGRILSPRLMLQLAAPAAASDLAATLHADAEPMLGSWAYPLSLTAALEKIEWAIAQTNRRDALAYVFYDRATGRFAGWCSAVRWHEARDDIAMLTYWIGKEFEGQGFVVEAIRTAGPHILAWINTSRLGAGAYLYNERSRRTMQRAGLTTPDGVRQLWSSTRGRYEPIVCFAAPDTEVLTWAKGSKPLSGTTQSADRVKQTHVV